MTEPEQLVRLAIEACQERIASGQSPFGCAIALEDRVLARAHNTVASATDITAHAESPGFNELQLSANDLLV